MCCSYRNKCSTNIKCPTKKKNTNNSKSIRKTQIQHIHHSTYKWNKMKMSMKNICVIFLLRSSLFLFLLRMPIVLQSIYTYILHFSNSNSSRRRNRSSNSKRKYTPNRYIYKYICHHLQERGRGKKEEKEKEKKVHFIDINSTRLFASEWCVCVRTWAACSRHFVSLCDEFFSYI